MREVLGKRLGDAEADLAFNFYSAAYRRAWRLFDDVRPCFAALQGAKLGMITHGEPATQRRKIDALGLSAHFDVTVIADEVGVAKPDARIFAMACARLGAPPERAIHIGNDRRVDAEGAAAAGLRGFWLDRFGLGSDDPLRIASLSSVPSLLAGTA
ncbi:HAD superfamily hydrolase (TIGR01509 family) [Rhodoblastus acidophilus]|uniref:HAD family hydrolase n=1 Tax=Rhodoblastus acidophilus TaxID=1074 RepID=UPI0022247678|nr:HAD family hydrolase [Rhodoblastus acidophilus]MCW2285604.1 HAD superfamily hydrolase (TIGR01509 family) [Rhodoblastus acidophilus]MCW2334480.1 HAD superfamily hydrolase (TIGR01509 family) [Rhodoblastus acidophilus]